MSFPTSRSKNTIVKEIKEACKRYHARGFRVVDIHADNEFEKAENDILPIRLRCCGTDDHVPEIERSVQTQKNEKRAVCSCHALQVYPTRNDPSTRETRE